MAEAPPTHTAGVQPESYRHPIHNSAPSSSRGGGAAASSRRAALLVLRGEEDENSAIWGLTDLGNANFGQFGRWVGGWGQFGGWGWVVLRRVGCNDDK